MKPRRPLAVSLSSAAMVVFFALAWVLFAPPQIGGQTSYVILNGNSMEPGMKRGDLAIVREAGSYKPGDVVTYRHPQIGPVIHRIIGNDGARFVLQGDNNDFIDSYHPDQGEVVGKLWIHIPGVGTWLARFREPVSMAGLLFVAFIGFGGAAARSQSKTPKGRTGRPAYQARHSGTPTGESPMNQLLRNWQDTVSVLAAAGIAFIAVGWVAFHRPTHHEVPANIPYSQSLEYAYSAVPSDSRVYDTGVATPGEPVYRQLSSQVAFHIDYRFDAEAAALAGSYHLVAELGDQNGWKRTIELTPATPFSGAGFTAEGVLDLATAQSLISVLEEQGGVKNDRYSVHIRPQVEVAGTIRGARFEDSFDEPLTMSLDGVQLKMAVEFDNETPLAPRTDGLVATERTEANTIKLLVFTLPVGLARALAAAGMGFVLAASGWLVIVQSGKDHGRDPITSRAATRAEALQVATRLFMNHRLTELDTAIRRQGLVPPIWEGTQEGHLDALAAYARANGVAA